MYKFGRIILEHHTYCNRDCKWCLKPYMSKNDSCNVMTDEILDLILNEIYNNIYLFKTDKLTFSLFRYNEPLYRHDILIKFAKTIKKFFNDRNIDTYIYIHSNGDYLNKVIFTEVMEHIDEITINNYSNSNIIDILEFIEKNNLDLQLVRIHENPERRDRIYFKYNNKSVTFFVNSEKDLLKTSRGSFLNQKLSISDGKWANNCVIRDYGCDILGKILVIDYDGTINACCETSSRIPFHRGLMLGNIKNGISSFINNYDINIYEEQCCKYCHMSSKICGSEDDNIAYK